MSMSVVTQRQSIYFSGSISALKTLLDRIGGYGTVSDIDSNKIKAFGCIDLSIEGKVLIMEWHATPVNDMYADTVLSTIMQIELMGNTIKGTSNGTKPDKIHFRECLIETLQDMFGENSVPKMVKGNSITVTIDNHHVDIDLNDLVA